MAFELEYFDIITLLNKVGITEGAGVIASYLLDCIDYDLNLSYYIWNTALFNVQIFDNKKDALTWIDKELCVALEDCILYETDEGVYLEY